MAEEDETPTGPVQYRSVSQLKQWEQCPYQYKLERRDRAWQRPAAWLCQGTAVHRAAEAWEKSGRTMPVADARDAFREEYAAQATRMCGGTPNFQYWFASGPYGGQTDLERRYGIGLQQVDRYIRYYETIGKTETVWRTPDGTPAIELPFNVDLGGVRVRGFIDQVVMVRPQAPKPKPKAKKALADYFEQMAAAKPRPIPRDIKTGNQPGDDFQLGVYNVALEVQYGQRADHGDYWMAKSGKPTAPYDLSKWTKESVTEKFQQVDEEIRAEKFDPKPEESKCRFCSVSTACEFRFRG
jgi:putative RecB family exonuclease